MSDIFDLPVEDCITLICRTCGRVIRAALPNYPAYFIAEGVCRRCEAPQLRPRARRAIPAARRIERHSNPSTIVQVCPCRSAKR